MLVSMKTAGNPKAKEAKKEESAEAVAPVEVEEVLEAEEAEVHTEDDPWDEFQRLQKIAGDAQIEPFSAVELMRELRS